MLAVCTERQKLSDGIKDRCRLTIADIDLFLMPTNQSDIDKVLFPRLPDDFKLIIQNLPESVDFADLIKRFTEVEYKLLEEILNLKDAVQALELRIATNETNITAVSQNIPAITGKPVASILEHRELINDMILVLTTYIKIGKASKASPISNESELVAACLPVYQSTQPKQFDSNLSKLLQQFSDKAYTANSRKIVAVDIVNISPTEDWGIEGVRLKTFCEQLIQYGATNSRIYSSAVYAKSLT